MSFDPPQEKYHVIKLKGMITYKSNQQQLKRKSTFLSLEDLVFSEDAGMYVLNEEGKVFKLIQTSHNQKYKLQQTSLKVGTRPGKILEYIAFQQFLADRKLLILGNNLYIEVGEEAFPLDEEQFFYIQYDWNGESIPKKLSYQGNRIIIQKDKLFQVDGQPIDADEVANFALYYFNQTTEESLFINHFQPIFPPEDTLIQEIKLIQAISKRKKWTKKDYYQVIENYLVVVYGVPAKEHFLDWLGRCELKFDE